MASEEKMYTPYMNVRKSARGRAIALGAMVMVVASAAACAEYSAPAAPADDESMRLEVVSGNNQSAPAGTELPQPLVVRALNASGTPIANQIINFRVTLGGGSVFAGTAKTNSNGYAREWWTLGPSAGLNRIEARAVHSGTGERLVFGVFEATATGPDTTGGGGSTATLTSVTVTPDSSNIQVGQTVQLSAALRDQNGDAMTGSVTWSSLNAAVASVDTTGRVSGAAAGSARIVGQSGVRADTAVVVVTAAPPPPPPPPPTGGSVVFSEDFESGSFATWDDGYDATTHRIVTSTTGAAHGGSRYLEITYPAGVAEGGGWLTKFLPQGYDSLRFSYWVRFPSTWTGGSYLFGLYGSPASNPWGAFGQAGVCANGSNYTNHFVYVTGGGSPGPASFYTYHADMLAQAGDCWGDAGTGRATYGSGRTMSRAVWHNVVLEVRLNTVGQSNGWQRMYIDGALVGEWRNMRQRTTSSIQLSAVQISAQTSGGAASTVRTLRVDDLQVTTLGATDTTTTPPPPPPPPPPAPVASVTVSPSAPSIQTGSTLQLTATTRDSAGNTLTGRTVTWASNNTAVATVNSTGRVTAVAAGSATITATSEGRSGSATVTVTAPPPTGGGSGGTSGGTLSFTNEPTGMTLITDYTMNSLTGGGWQYVRRTAYAQAVVDSTAPGDAGAIEFVFPQGFTSAGETPASFYPPSLGSGRSEVYLGFTIKPNANWQDHASLIDKLLYGWIGNATTFGLTWHKGTELFRGMAFFTGGRYYWANQPNAQTVQPGVWSKVEMYFRPATNGSNGVLRIWVNGVLSTSYDNVQSASGSVTDLYFEPTWGGAGGPAKQQTDYLRFGHARISVR